MEIEEEAKKELPQAHEPEILPDDKKATESEDTPEGESGDKGATESTEDDTAGETVTFGDEEPELEPSQGIKQLRDAYKGLKKENEGLQRRLDEREQAQKGNASAATDPGEEPTFEASGYDPEAYKHALLDWNSKKTEAERAADTRKQSEEEEAATYREKVKQYHAIKEASLYDGFDEMEDAVKRSLSIERQGFIVQTAESPESLTRLIYALGRYPSKLQKLASIKNNVSFIAEVARMEKTLTVRPRLNTPPPPDEKITRTSGAQVNPDKKLEQLRAEASKTNDFTKVVAYKRELKARK